MAAGNILLQANDSKVANIVFEDGASGNMSVTVPKEGGTLANEAYVTSAISTIPVIPSASQTAQGIIEIATVAEVQTGTDTTRAVTPAGFAAGSLGVGQTWQNVTASRAIGTTYTNTTGKPISLSVWCIGTAAFYSLAININSVVTYFNQDYANAAGYSIGATIIIPNGATYSISVASMTLTNWFELR